MNASRGLIGERIEETEAGRYPGALLSHSRLLGNTVGDDHTQYLIKTPLTSGRNHVISAANVTKLTLQLAGVSDNGHFLLFNNGIGTQLAVIDAAANAHFPKYHVTNHGEIRWYESISNGSNYVGLKAAGALSSDTVWVLPTADGDPGDVIVTDGSGNLSFAPPGGGGAPTTASYVTISSEAGLSAERALTEGTAINITDNGANSTVVISVDPSEIDHGNLASLTGDHHLQYLHLNPGLSTRNIVKPPDGNNVKSAIFRAGNVQTENLLEFQLNNQAVVASVGASGLLSEIRNDIQTTSTQALLLTNNTAATDSITTQYSPALDFVGHAWQDSDLGGADRTVRFRTENRPASGAAATGVLTWRSSVDSGTASFTDRMTLSTDGKLSLPTTGISAGISIGGDVNMFRGAADILYLGSGDSIRIQGTTGRVLFPDNTDNTGGILLGGEAGIHYQSSDDELRLAFYPNDAKISHQYVPGNLSGSENMGIRSETFWYPSSNQSTAFSAGYYLLALNNNVNYTGLNSGLRLQASIGDGANVSSLVGGQFRISHGGTGTATLARGGFFWIIDTSTGHYTEAIGVDIQVPTITDNSQIRRGINIAAMPSPGAFTGTTIFAIDIRGSGGARDGIRFRGSNTSNLYGGAAGRVDTDGNFNVGGGTVFSNLFTRLTAGAVSFRGFDNDTGAGGDATFRGGDSSADGDYNGGTVLIRGGVKAGSGTVGAVRITKSNGSTDVLRINDSGATMTDVWDAGSATSFKVPTAAGGTSLTSSGQVTTDTTKGTFDFHDGTARRVLDPLRQAAFVLDSPTASDDFGILRFDRAVTLVKVVYEIEGGTNWVGQLQKASNAKRSGATDTQSSDSTVTDTTTVTSFDVSSFSAGDWICLKTTSVSGSVAKLYVNFYWRVTA